MHMLRSERTSAILHLSILILIAGCIKTGILPNDPTFTGDYKLIPQWTAVATDSLTVFKVYRIPCVLGSDPFKTITAFTSPNQIIDTAFFNAQSQNGTLTLFFLDTGTYTLIITGLRPNDLHVSDTEVITVRNPYRITGSSILGIEEPAAFSLSPAPEATEFNLGIEWNRSGDTNPKLLAPAEPYQVTPMTAGWFSLRASLVDTGRNHRFTAGSLTITVPGYRPAIDSLRLIDTALVPGDSIAFHVHASDRDSGALKVIASTKKQGQCVRSDTFRLAAPKGYSIVLTGTKPVIDTGMFCFSVEAIDMSGLRSNAAADTFTVTANPPVVKFQPDTAIMNAPVDCTFMLNVTATADSFAWNYDGKDTISLEPLLSRIFLTQQKKTSTVTVMGIDNYGYRGPARTVLLVEETCYYDLSFKHIPGDSAFFGNACWEVWTSRPDLVKANDAKFSWILLRLPSDTIYRTTVSGTGDSVSKFSIADLAIPGIKLDSADLKVFVVLHDTLPAKNSSPMLYNSSRIRRFRPTLKILSIAPHHDSVSAGQKVVFGFKAFDVNPGGSIDSTFWKYPDSPSVHPIPAGADTLSFTWPTPRTVTVCLWTRDNDGQLSDTVKTTLTVVKSAPAVASMKKPAAAYAGMPCTLSVSVRPGFSNAPLQSVRWSAPGLDDFVTGDTSGIFTFASTGWTAVTVTATDSLGDSSAPFTDSIEVFSGKPMARVSGPDSVPVRIQAVFKCRVTDANGTVDSLCWKQADGADVYAISLKGGDSTIRHAWATCQSVLLKIWAKDNTGGISDTVIRALTVTPGEPVVRGIALDTPATGIYVNEPIRFFVDASDTNGEVIRYRIVLKKTDGSDSLSVRDTSDTLSLTVPHGGGGTYTIHACAGEDDSLWSNIYRHPAPITILSGIPAVTAFSPETVWIKKPTRFTVTGTDGNGSIRLWAVSWDAGVPFEIRNDGTFTHTYTTDGTGRAKVFVVDDDGVSSDTVNKDIFVKLGKPRVTSIAVDRPVDSIYIRDSLDFTFKGEDNDGIDSILVSWNGDTTFEVRRKATGDSITCNDFQFARPDSGVRSIIVRVKDSLGLTGDSAVTVTVLAGAPIIDSMTPSTVWVVDQNAYTIHARDKNGRVDSFAVDWNNDGTWKENKTKTISHGFDTARAGFRTVRVKVMDDDSVWTTKNIPINVRLGRPLVMKGTDTDTIQWVNGQNGTPDTMFYIWSSGNSFIIVDTTDSNGVIERYDWDRGDNGTIDYPYTASKVLNQYFVPNAAELLSVRGRDDDNLWSNKLVFYVFPDEIPPVQSVTHSVKSDTVRLYWSGIDKKDLTSTLYKIILKKGSAIGTADESNAQYILSDFKAGNQYSPGTPNDDFSFSFTPTEGNGKYYYRIIAKDARGSLNRNTGDPNFNY